MFVKNENKDNKKNKININVKNQQNIIIQSIQLNLNFESLIKKLEVMR